MQVISCQEHGRAIARLETDATKKQDARLTEIVKGLIGTNVSCSRSAEEFLSDLLNSEAEQITS